PPGWRFSGLPSVHSAASWGPRPRRRRPAPWRRRSCRRQGLHVYASRSLALTSSLQRHADALWPMRQAACWSALRLPETILDHRRAAGNLGDRGDLPDGPRPDTATETTTGWPQTATMAERSPTRRRGARCPLEAAFLEHRLLGGRLIRQDLRGHSWMRPTNPTRDRVAPVPAI